MNKRSLSLFFILVIGWFSVFGENPTLTGISFKSGLRGLALALETDMVSVESFRYELEIRNKNSVVKIKLKNAVYGLDEVNFHSFPENSPIEEINAMEAETGVIVEVVLQYKIADEIKSKQVKNRTILLISSKPFSDLRWSSSGSSKNQKRYVNSGKDASNNKNDAIIKSMKLIQRGYVEQFIIETDTPTRIKTKKKNGSIIAVFENTLNGLSRNLFTLPDNSAFKKVAIKESRYKGINIVGVTLDRASSLGKLPFVQVKPSSLILFAVREDLPRLSLWSTDDNRILSYNLRDISNTKGQPVSYSPTTPQAELNKEPATKPVRVVVVNDRVNVRSEPSTPSSENIIDCIPLGSKGNLLKKQTNWRYIHLDNGTVGWIYASMVVDSMLVSREKWEKIYNHEAKKGTIQLAMENPSKESDIQATIPYENKNDKSGSSGTANDNPFTQSAEEDIDSGKEFNNSKGIVKYRILGRDPYLPLNECDFLQSELLDVENSTLVGILYDEKDRIALLEDNNGEGEAYAFREKAHVKNGSVLKIKRNSVIFLLNEGDFSRTFTLRLKLKEK